MQPLKKDQGHQDAIAAMRAGKWRAAVELLARNPALVNPFRLNDLAAALHQDHRLEKAVEALKIGAAHPKAPALLQLNLTYMEKALAIQNNFDPAWQHQDFDGIACPARPPLVSVIVRTYQRTDHLAEALSSLRAQTFVDFETIVVNDGGDPAAQAVVETSGLANARYAMRPHRDRVHAMNDGLAMAHGKYITGLDDDDVAYPHHLKTLVEFLEAHPEIYAAYPGYQRVGLVDHGPSAGELFREERKGKSQSPDRLTRTNPVPAVMLMARRECYEKAGRFCPDLDLGEDWEMWLRLQESFRLEHLPVVTAEIRERPGQANITYRRLREKYFWDNTLLYLHRAIILASAPLRPELADAFQLGMRLLDQLVKEKPEVLTLLNLRGLWEMKKPYSWFADQGRWFKQLGELELSRRFYGMAARLNPLEPKVWSGWARSFTGSGPGKPSGKGKAR